MNNIDLNEYQNLASCFAEVVKIQYPKLTFYTDNDTYVTSRNVWYSYYDAAVISSGVYDNEQCKMFMSFDKIQDKMPNEKIIRNVIFANLIVRSIKRFSGTINVYETKDRFEESNMSWVEYPIKDDSRLIGSTTVNNALNIEIPLDIQYIKNILSKKEVHNGYYIEVVQEDGTSNILNIHSSNSSTDIFKPRLEVEYVDPAQTVSKVEVESEINYKPISYLISELNLDFLVDKVDSNLVFSKDSITNVLPVKPISILNSEISYKINDTSSLISNLTISREYFNGNNIIFGSQSHLVSELTLKQNEKSILDTELPLRIKGLKSNLDTDIHVLFENNLNTELNLKEIGYINTQVPLRFKNNKSDLTSQINLKLYNVLNTELPLRIKNVEESLLSELTLVIKDSSNLTSQINLKLYNGLNTELPLRIKNVEESLLSELTLVIKDSSNLTSDLNFKLYNGIDTELPLRITATNNLVSEINFRYENILNTELPLVIRTEKYLDSELRFKRVGESDLDSELDLRFKDDGIINDFKLIFEDNLYTKLPLRFTNIQSNLDTDFILKFIDTNSMLNELNLVFGSDLDSEITLLIREKSELPTEMRLPYYNHLNSNVLFGSQEHLATDLSLLFHTSLDTKFALVINGSKYLRNELRLKLFGKQSINSELPLRFKNVEKPLLTELDLIKVGDSSLDSELNLKFAGKKELTTELPLRFKNVIKPLLSEVSYKVNKESDPLLNELALRIPAESYLLNEIMYDNGQEFGLDTELTLLFKEVKDELNTELKVGYYKVLNTEIPLKFLGKDEGIINEVPIKFYNNKGVPTELELKFNKETSIDSELTYKIVEEKPLVNELALKFTNSLDSEIELRYKENSNLDTELDLGFNNVTKSLLSEVTYKIMKESYLNSNILIKVNKLDELDTELRLVFNKNESILNSELLVKYKGIIGLDTELRLVKDFESSIESEVYFTENNVISKFYVVKATSVVK